jgi:hypothetical protein
MPQRDGEQGYDDEHPQATVIHHLLSGAGPVLRPEGIPVFTTPSGRPTRDPDHPAGSVRTGYSVDVKYHILICIHMPSRNIAVQKAVYDALAKEKRQGESFTSLLRRLLDQRGGIEDAFGSWRRPTPRTRRKGGSSHPQKRTQ